MTPPPILMDQTLHRVAVFRALNLGDMLCAVPALRALRMALPQAHIALIGLASAAPFVERYTELIDELILFPGHAAFPEQSPRESEIDNFYARMRERRFDLALQLHGSGLHSNAVVSELGARHQLGFVPDASREEAGRFMAWPDDQPEILRYLMLLRFLGIPTGSSRIEFPLTREDRTGAARVTRACGFAPETTVFVHPGARLASRRWPVYRFAAVARAFAEAGWTIAVTGSAGERDLVDALVAQIGRPAVNLCGRTTLGELAGLLETAALLICNDTGISHVAAAMGTPSIVIACGSDVRRWAPLDTHRHRVLYEPMACRPCAHEFCPIGHPCALAIQVEQVLDEARSHFGIGTDSSLLTGA